MTVLSAYMNQSVTLERRKLDAEGEPVGNEWEGESYEDAETILALYEPASGTVRTATGATVAVESRVVTETEVKLGDKVADSVVKRVVPVIDFDGTTTEWEAFLRMAKSFQQGAQELERMVGGGTLAGIFAVDGGERTVPLEVGGWRNFMGRYGPKAIEHYTPPGGPHAAQRSLEAQHERSLEVIAKLTLVVGPQEGMKHHVERMDSHFKQIAPRVTGDYADSTRRIVADDGVVIHDRRGAHYGQEPNG